MLPILAREVAARELAERLQLECEGDAIISVLAPLDELRPGALGFAARHVAHHNAEGAALIATLEPIGPSPPFAWIRSRNPRLDLARALRLLAESPGFVPCDVPPKIDGTSRVHSTATVGRNVVVGARTTIGAHAHVGDDVVIGNDCIVKPHACIGESGYGFERAEDGTPVRLLHFGGVTIGNNVEIGSFTTVCQGTLTPTTIADGVKIDDHCHIAHNVRIEKNVMVVACAEVSGSVVLGEGCYVGPNASIRDGLKIGARAFVGIGAVVVRDVPPDVTVAGCPAKVMEPRSR